LKISFNVKLSSRPVFSEWSSSGLPTITPYNPVCMSCASHACYIPNPSTSSFSYWNNIW
jgi:hypothetical protein